MKPKEIIELEKYYGIELIERKELFKTKDIVWNSRNHYTLNDEGHVIKLNLERNKFKNIGPISKLYHLNVLELDTNEIEDLSPLSSLNQLNILKLGENKIRDIRPLSNLTDLAELGLSNNQLEDIYPLSSLIQLKILKLDNNEIRDIRPLAFLTDLAKLGLNNNQIEDIYPLTSLIQLPSLFLDSNIITDIRPLASLNQLTTLNLSNNQISDIQPLASLNQLTTLNLSNNQIWDIQPLSSLTKLEHLDIANNRVNRVEKDFVLRFSEIYYSTDFRTKGIILGGNPLDVLLIEIIQTNNTEKRNQLFHDYYERKEQGKISLRYLKLILLGNTGVGKTTLADIFSGEEKANDGTTHGINFFNIDNEKGIAVKGYDFGGQDYYHSSHYSFFDDQSLYIILWGNGQSLECSTNKDGERLYPLAYWLGSLNPYAAKKVGNDLFADMREKLGSLETISKEEREVLENTPLNKVFQFEAMQSKEKKAFDSLNMYDFLQLLKAQIPSADSEPEHLPHLKNFKNRIQEFGNTPDIFQPEMKEFMNSTGANTSFNMDDLFSKSTQQKDFHFQVILLQNQREERVFLNQKDLMENYPYIRDFQEYNLHKPEDKSEVKIWIETLIDNHYRETEVNTVDNRLINSFSRPEIQKKVILSFNEVRKLETSIQNYDDEKLKDLLKLYHKILACYYLEIDERIKGFFFKEFIEKIQSSIIVNIEEFTQWIYEILNKEELLQKQEGYFTKSHAELWLKDDLAKRNIDFLLAFMLQNKLIFQIKNSDEKYFAPNYLKSKISKTEKLFIEKFEPAPIKYYLKGFFHNSILSDIISQFYENLMKKNPDSEPMEYVLWKDKILLIEDSNKEDQAIVLIELHISDNNPPELTVKRYANDKENSFFQSILDYVENRLDSYEYEKYLRAPNGHYINFDDIKPRTKDLEGKTSNLFVSQGILYRKSDFSLFLKDSKLYPMLKLFISYSKYDDDYRKEFIKHLITLKDDGLIDSFNCEEIDLGENSHNVIQRELETCDYMIALVSIDYLNTEYIRKFELERAKELGKKIIPIIIKPCDWENSRFVKDSHAALRGRNISLDQELFRQGTFKETTPIERHAWWAQISKEFRGKLFK